MMLCRLLSRTDRRRFRPAVVSLIPPGPVGGKIRALGVPVASLGMRRGLPSVGAVFRLAGSIRAFRPHVIQTWMYHADLIGGVAAKLAGSPPVVWGIHNSTLDRRTSSPMTIRIARLNARLSRWLPARIVSCSRASMALHARLGYDSSRIQVIPNGFDVSLFAPDPGAGATLRAQLGIPAGSPVIGIIARFDPQKDHRNFFRAAKRLLKRLPGVHFAAIGDGVEPANRLLADWVGAAGAAANTRLLGRRDDVHSLMAGMDIVTSSSAYGEAFPLVIGEAMACGVPCVVTDVGDSAMLAGETGLAVPPRDPAALARAWEALLSLTQEERTTLGLRARARVESEFELGRIAGRYDELYRELATGR
ncbi:glycosyltransferase [Candidatus Poribacteria bacterium]|nr:glycosyltransferase [Candidatus Poribacteria bacterium]